MMTDDGNVHLDHVLNIKLPSLSPLIEQALTKAVKSFDRACYDVSNSVTVIGYAGERIKEPCQNVAGMCKIITVSR
ncbi:hypothetical protein ACHAXA_009933 [Cyclostephanos tholiformis]|uniref:Uncharacterized protein n=1 Tax=Cyclostephanos tholiformis TaxID=382380 RepID=A0ABD3RY36_9STRA